MSSPASIVHLSGHGRGTPRDVLGQLADEAGELAAGDFYGAGEVIESFEREVADLLGKPAAVFMPSGTMAQVIALRVHCERLGVPKVAFHPTSHLELHEQAGYRELHGLDSVLVGPADSVISMDSLRAIESPIAALLLELPQREIGGQLPGWDELCLQTEWARERGIALHLDGARLWEAQPHYGRPYHEIAGLFDSVYVSFYKGLGGVAGAVLAGDEALIAESRIWQRRHGGNLISLYPYVLSARRGLRQKQSRFSAYRDRARSLASAWGQIPNVSIVPQLPDTNMMHVHLRVAKVPAESECERQAEAHGIRLFKRLAATPNPELWKFEVSIGDNAMAMEDADLVRILSTVVSASAPTS